MKLQDIIQIIEDNQSKITVYGKFDNVVLKKINYKLRLDWNYYSNRMEGGTLTREETRSVMVGNIDVKGKPFRDVAEMTGHDKVVLEVLLMSKGDLKISEKRMKEIHRAIMYEEDAVKKKLIGEWKTKANEIINYKGEKILFTQPIDVPDAVHKLIDKTNSELEKKQKHALQIAAQFHIDLVSIHPFYDGNGRTTRILTNVILLACGYPAIIIKDEHKNAYYQLLGDIQAYGGNADLFYAFIGERIIDTQKIVLDALAGKDIEEEDDLGKRVALLESMLQGTDDEIKETKNPRVLAVIFEKIVEPLFLKVYEKVHQISHLFSITEITYFINNSGESASGINELFRKLSVHWKEKNGYIDKVSFNFQLKKLKKLGTKAFDEHEDLYFIFEDAKYKIQMGECTFAENLYHQYLTLDEMEKIANKFVNVLMDRIEERVKKISEKK